MRSTTDDAGSFPIHAVRLHLVGNLHIKPAEGGTGIVPFYGDKVIVDSPGSSDIRIDVDPPA